jgi:alpha-tubulin suppressor-like RCC1 family protein
MVRLLLACALGATGWSFMASGPGAADGGAPTDGVLFAMGTKDSGQLGDGTLTARHLPTRVSVSALPAGTEFATVSAGANHSCALTTTGTPYCWGGNWEGQLGDGSTTSRQSPQPVSISALPVQTFASIAAGGDHTCALTTTGTPYCWGYNWAGQLGTGDGARRTSPTAVNTSTLPVQTFAFVSAGSSHTCALTTTGVAYCWGYNWSRQLGDGTGSDRNSPSAVAANGATFSAITAGTGHSCALTATGVPYCWGSGPLGVDTTSQTATPIAVSISALPVQSFLGIHAAWQHSCILDTSGTPYCWGANWAGQLGTGDTTSQAFPTAVSVSALPVQTFASITTGSIHTCALTTTGLPYCWGDNGAGRLGTGDTTVRLNPTAVNMSGLPAQTIDLISAGGAHTLILSSAPAPSPALIPTFDTPVTTVDGFTLNVTNYDPLFTWAATVGAGTIATGSATGAVWPLTITGLTAGASTTVTVSTTRAGYDAGTATVSGTVQAAPAGGSPPPIPTQTTTTTTPSSTTSSPTTPSTTSAPTTTPPPATPAPDPGALEPPSAQIIADLPTRTLIEFSTLQAGGTVTVTGDGFQAKEPVVLAVASTPRIIATGVADTTGTARLTGTIPLDLPAGQHTLVIYAPNSGHGQRQPITITAPYLPATGTQPSPVLAVLAVLGGLLALNLRWWRLRPR